VAGVAWRHLHVSSLEAGIKVWRRHLSLFCPAIRHVGQGLAREGCSMKEACDWLARKLPQVFAWRANRERISRFEDIEL
jgi:hypothetical protein